MVKMSLLLRFAMVFCILFFSCIFAVVNFLSRSEKALQFLQSQTGEAATDELGPLQYRQMYTQLREENEDLKDQLHSLQQELFELRSGGNAVLNDCRGWLENQKRINKTEVFGGIKYRSETQIAPYVRFSLWKQYPVIRGFGGKVVEKLNGLKRIEVDEVIDSAVVFLRSSTSRNDWHRDHFVEGIYRTADAIGTHYETYFNNGTLHRVTLFRPHGPSLSIQQERLTTESKINVIVPLYGRYETLRLYLANFATLISKRSNIHLTLVFFGDAEEFTKVVQPFIVKYRFHQHTIKHVTDRNFSRGYALNVGIQAWSFEEDPVVFLSDVDVIYTNEFLNRCLLNTERLKRVYYPIIFSLYNPEVVEQYYGQKIPSWNHQLKVSVDVGFWRDFGYGMACMYRSDYMNTGGFPLNVQGWGEEDVVLYRKFAQSSLMVIRAPDPDIFHLWHPKQCDPALSDDQYRGCIQTKALNEGSHIQLGYTIFKNQIELRRKRFEHL